MSEVTPPTTNPDLIAAIKKLDKHVPWYEWCDLEKQVIDVTRYQADGLPLLGEYKRATCPPACEAAVVMWAGDLCKHLVEELHWGSAAITYWEGERFRYRFETDGERRYCEACEKYCNTSKTVEEVGFDSSIEAAAALIIAIAARLEE